MKSLTDTEELSLLASDPTHFQVRLIEHTLDEAVEYIRKVCGGKLPQDEQLSIAGWALTQAAKNYQPGPGRRLMTFARPALRGGVMRAWRDREAVTYGDKIPPKTDPCTLPDPLVDLVEEPGFKEIDLKERWAIIKPLIQRLNENERRVLTLAYESGFTFQTIADMQGNTRAAAHRTHQEALRKIREWLVEDKKFFALKA